MVSLDFDHDNEAHALWWWCWIYIAIMKHMSDDGVALCPFDLLSSCIKVCCLYTHRASAFVLLMTFFQFLAACRLPLVSRRFCW